jgi:hypothetical protein
MATKIKSKPIACVVKITPKKHGSEAILFYREDRGDLTCFTLSEGHSNCCRAYYWECRSPKTPKEIHEADELFTRYDAIPGSDVGIVRRCQIVRRKRLER